MEFGCQIQPNRLELMAVQIGRRSFDAGAGEGSAPAISKLPNRETKAIAQVSKRESQMELEAINPRPPIKDKISLAPQTRTDCFIACSAAKKRLYRMFDFGRWRPIAHCFRW